MVGAPVQKACRFRVGVAKELGLLLAVPDLEIIRAGEARGKAVRFLHERGQADSAPHSDLRHKFKMVAHFAARGLTTYDIMLFVHPRW
jgi:hypothetical protein